MSSEDLYINNPLIHRKRNLANEESEWVRSFACDDMNVLIVCRGPIRQEALDVFAEMGMTHCGILLSQKDSIVYPRALSPELRRLDPSRVHAVPDYTGASKEERNERIEQIIRIARRCGYEYVFAGYGFMAEDEDFVAALEDAGLKFVGPCSGTVSAAGAKDEAKRTAERVGVSVTPGVNDVTTKIILQNHKNASALKAVAKEHGLDVPELGQKGVDLDSQAVALLNAAHDANIDLYTIDEVGAQAQTEAAAMLKKLKGSRVRLKAIGGGGGKGQRIISDAADAPEKVREILNEVKATGVGDNKNILVELNIETTRHNEIQLLGNGQWCISLGGRDCSLQMHEQKLLEVSLTQEALGAEVENRKAAGDKKGAKAVAQDLEILRKMEDEAERFGQEVGLDSASTFECIVDGANHYFMEVNTRIQVEHRVSELCYALRFRNPNDSEDYFDVFSVVEAMALLAKHKERLPRPERIVRDAAAVEARLNATDASLSPHAGGEILHWSDPIEGEIRDDQGICYKNPDTGLFVRYKLAGAYDSNIALLVTTGDDREDSYRKLAEVLRCAELRGPDLQTNLHFHYGLVHWFLANGVCAKPTTRFVVPYLTLVGLLRQEADQVDVSYAYGRVASQYLGSAGDDPAAIKATNDAVQIKRTLVERPIDVLMKSPHLMSAWLSAQRDSFKIEKRRVTWLTNPLQVLSDTYWLLHMNSSDTAAAARRIWADDQEIIDEGHAFYAAISEKAGEMPWQKLDSTLRGQKPAFGFDADTWTKIRGAHHGFQLGLELLGLMPLIAEKVGFYDLRVRDDLTISIPDKLFDSELQAAMKKILVPPPATKADEIVAASGGMYYAQEGPGMPPFVSPGHHFEAGDTLYIIEVMKMFNRVHAPFAGTVDKVLVDTDGTIVSKGQPLFKVTPDERMVEEDPSVVRQRVEENTDTYLSVVA